MAEKGKVKGMLNYYAVNLDLKQKKCLVVGGGQVACRKVKGLLECEADVLVIAPELDPRLLALQAEGRIDCLVRNCEAADLAGFFLVILATNNSELNASLAKIALERQLLVNTVDNQALSNFIVPATYRKGLLTVSVSTGGASPLVAAKIKSEIAELYGEEYALLLDKLREERDLIKKQYATQKERQEVLRERVKELMAQCIC